MFTIGKIATKAGVTTDALRYYEREGLLDPSGKSDSGYRLYDESAVLRLRFIRQAQECGFTLSEIRSLLQIRGADDACCSDVRKLALEKKLQLEARIRSMSIQGARFPHRGLSRRRRPSHGVSDPRSAGSAQCIRPPGRACFEN